ncbi:cytochrome P450 monooxygenase pc-3 [Mycena haematopus]|nr:cytochrome P450 monooxygenase pc-3 [Mycena haematopus]
MYTAITNAMAFPPGISYTLKLLPSIFAPPLGTCFLKWVSETYLNMHVSRWVFAPLCLFSFPLIFTARVQYELYANRRAAAARGAALPPTVPASIGGLDLVRNTMRDRETQYPGEPLALLTKTLGNIFCLRILFENRFFTCEPEHLKILLSTEFNSFEKGEDTRVIFEPLLGSGIFSADGELWKFHRAMTRPFFKRDRVSDFELFDRHSNDAISAIKTRSSEGYPIDFQDIVSRFAMDSSSEFLFGHNAHTLAAGLPYPSYVAAATNTDASSAFASALNLAQRITMSRGAFGGAWPLTEFWHDKLTQPIRVVRAFLDPILSDAVARRRANGGEKEFETSEVVGDREVQEGESLVDHLLHYIQDQTMLRDEILNISTAGRDTTACLLTFVVYMLTDNPHVLTKLRTEILGTVGPLRAPTPDDFRDMKYMRAVLNETLRLYPPVPLNMRSTTVPVIFPSVTGGKPFYLPAKSKVPFSVLLMHRRKDLWGPDALRWDPERFLDDRLHKYLTPNPFIFLPFNAGPRICIGQQFAYHEASFFLVRLLQNFSDISLVPTAQPIPYTPCDASADPLGWKRSERLAIKTHLTMFIEGGLWVSMAQTDNVAV